MPEKIDWLEISQRIRSLIVSPSVDGRVDAANAWEATQRVGKEGK